MRALIAKLKRAVKKESEYLDKCEKYDRDPDFIDGVDISFKDDLDVSAKTVDGEVFLNGSLFDHGDWNDQMRYIIHEVTHVMQQEAGKVDGPVNKADYLDDKNELEAFRAQISYMSSHESPEEVQRYLEQLLDHHNIRGKERAEKARKLTLDV
jgi:hypothetical protein